MKLAFDDLKAIGQRCSAGGNRVGGVSLRQSDPAYKHLLSTCFGGRKTEQVFRQFMLDKERHDSDVFRHQIVWRFAPLGRIRVRTIGLRQHASGTRIGAAAWRASKV